MQPQPETHDAFDDFLNEAFPEPVSICWHLFHPADALKRLDPEGYENLKRAWLAERKRPELKLVKGN